ncbi:MAG: tetratricopeptide repeat protein, partial [Chloroflexi bacterium]|nr:tetratricopeptide repeat protein [Chloroflexota bacterium]
GEYLEALTILNHFPPSSAFRGAERLQPLVEQLLSEFDQTGEFEDPLDPVYFRAIDLIRRRNIPAGLDGLLGLIRQNKAYRSGIPHKVILGLFELLGEGHALVIEYRPLLANTLF